MVAACRKLVGHFRHSVVAMEALRSQQAKVGQPKLKFIQDVSTRWNSTYYMLSRLLALSSEASAVLSDDTVTEKAD